MRNLKKMLSLVMALAMVASFMVVGASAAEFTDAKDITNTEAVSMLVELGVIKGRDTGVFDPTGIVTRAEMAKMICVVLNGGSEPQLGNITSNFTDVKGTANAWADPYIAFCAQQGIISGYEDGTFKPGNTVTGTEAAKMLLVAMGYNASIAGFTGGNWDVNVNVFANKNNLYKSMTINPSTGLSRDAAALMIFNALSAKVVNYEYTLAPVNGVLTSIPKLVESNKTLLEDAFKAIKVVGTVVGNEYANLNSSTKNDDGIVIGSALEAGKTSILVNNYDDQDTYKDTATTFSVTTGVEALGREVTLYVQPASSSVKATVLGNAIINENNKVVVDYTSDGIATVADDNNLDIKDTLVAVNYAGLSELSNAATKDDAAVAGQEKILIDNDNDGTVDCVLLNSYAFGKVSAYSTRDDGSITVTSKNASATYYLKSDDKDDMVGFDDVAKNDYVMAAFIGGKLHVSKAETVTGTLEAYKATSTLTVDGAKYNVSKVDAYDNGGDGIYAAKSFGSSTNLDNEATFYLDNFGYMIAAGDVAESSYNYALVWKFDLPTSLTRNVKVTLSDGTTATYKLSDKSDTLAVGGVYAYSLTDGVIKLTDPAATDETTADDAKFVKGKTAISGSGLDADSVAASDQSYYSSNSTTFFYVTMDGTDVDEVNVYAGYSKAPSLDTTGTAGAKIALNKGNKVVAVAFAGANLTATDVSEHLFVYSWGNTHTDYTEANVIMAGSDETKTINVDIDESFTGSFDLADLDDAIYLFTVDSKGNYILTPATPYVADKGGEKTINDEPSNASSTTFVAGGVEFKVVADSVLIDNTSSTPNAALKNTPSTDDTVVTVLANKDDEALMIVIDNGEDPAGPTVGDYTANVKLNNDTGELDVRYYTTKPTSSQISAMIRSTIANVATVKMNGIASADITLNNGDQEVYTLNFVTMYKVSVADIAGTTISMDKNYAAEDDVIEVTLKKDAGFTGTTGATITGTNSATATATTALSNGDKTCTVTVTMTALAADTVLTIALTT